MITHVQSLAIPLHLVTEESAASREIFATYTAELDEVQGRRPCVAAKEHARAAGTPFVVRAKSDEGT